MSITNASQCSYRRFYEDFFNWTPACFTYIVSCENSDLLKFGRSNAPDWRLVMMQTGCPFKLKIVWAWPEDVESELHAAFASQRVSGEWFRVSVDDAILVAGRLTKDKWRKECVNFVL